MRRELVSAYAASVSRVVSWAVVTGVVYRVDGPRGLALIAVARATVGFLAYAGLGIGPALVTLLPRYPRPEKSANAGSERSEEPDLSPVDHQALDPSLGSNPAFELRPASADLPTTVVPAPPAILEYQRPIAVEFVIDKELLWGGRWLAMLASIVIILAAAVYGSIEGVPGVQLVGGYGYSSVVIVSFAFGLAIRLYGDVAGAALQACGRITTDNKWLTVTEVTWAALVLALWFYHGRQGNMVNHAARAFAIAALVGTTARYVAARPMFGEASYLIWPNLQIAFQASRRVLPVGAMITTAALADFFYAPMNLVLLDRFTSTYAVAAYAPVLQIDVGLLVLVGGLSAVLLPKSSAAMARRDAATLRQYYVRGTLVSFGLLVVAGLAVCAVAPWLLGYWLGEAVPLTLQLLPFVMIHTAIGGASGVGRAVLLGMGRAKALAAAALVAGVCNVALAWTLVGPLGFDVWGVVYATILTVTLRCAVWMPWYVLRATRMSPATIM